MESRQLNRFILILNIFHNERIFKCIFKIFLIGFDCFLVHKVYVCVYVCNIYTHTIKYKANNKIVQKMIENVIKSRFILNDEFKTKTSQLFYFYLKKRTLVTINN